MSDNLNPALRDLARRNQTAFLNALASVSQTRVAEMLGVSESMVSRKKADIEEFCLLLAACGLKVALSSCETFDDEYIRALRTLASIGIKASPSSRAME